MTEIPMLALNWMTGMVSRFAHKALATLTEPIVQLAKG